MVLVKRLGFIATVPGPQIVGDEMRCSRTASRWRGCEGACCTGLDAAPRRSRTPPSRPDAQGGHRVRQRRRHGDQVRSGQSRCSDQEGADTRSHLRVPRGRRLSAGLRIQISVPRCSKPGGAYEPGVRSVSEAESLRMHEIATELVADAFPLPGVSRDCGNSRSPKSHWEVLSRGVPGVEDHR